MASRNRYRPVGVLAKMKKANCTILISMMAHHRGNIHAMKSASNLSLVNGKHHLNGLFQLFK
jgi:hypothetical protein